MTRGGYTEFLESKTLAAASHGIEPGEMHESLYPFQRAITGWAVRKGRAAIFADCGLGKTRMQIEWIQQMGAVNSLIVAPLCVAEQTIEEAKQMGVSVTYCTEPPYLPGMWITNYERLGAFVGASQDAIVLDESSILKSIDGKTRTLLLNEFTSIPYRLCCTATPAPNDVVELANHAEFLGVMSRPEFLASWFVHDAEGWRLKGHASDEFWRWVATWALYLRRPSDLGFEDEGFDLPPIHIDGCTVQCDFVPEGMLFNIGKLDGIQGRASARKQSIGPRVEACAELIRSSPGPWLVWCGLNDEGSQMAKALGDDAVLIEGKTSETDRVELYHRWRSGESQVLVTKPSMFGWGMNWQHCSQMAFLGLGDSYEQYYQAIRRCWRFGQMHPVNVWIVTSNAEADIVRNVRRKERESATMAAEIVRHVKEAEIEAISGTQRETLSYVAPDAMQLPEFI